MNISIVILLLLLSSVAFCLRLYWVLGTNSGTTAKVYQFQKWPLKRKWALTDKKVLPVIERKTSEIQLVLDATFSKQKLMNRQEYGLYVNLERMFKDHSRKMRLFSQVSLGEILSSDDKPAFFAINSKRCDFVIIDQFGLPVLVIEYQGRGHFQGNSAGRDEVKRIALKKAGVPTIEVLTNFNWPTVEKEILLYCGASH